MRDRLIGIWQAHHFQGLIILAISLFLSFVRPFGAGAGAPIINFLYWFALIFLGFAINRVSYDVIVGRVDAPLVVKLALCAFVIALGVTPTIILIQWWVERPVPVSYWPRLLLDVFVISAGVTAVTYLAENVRQKGAESAVPAQASARHLIDEKLPLKLKGAALIAIVSEDHYCRVYTERGEAMVLMRLADAITALEGENGLQTHRSWWVARSAVDNAERKDGRITLTLKNGIEAPVSRSFAAAIRQAGWV